MIRSTLTRDIPDIRSVSDWTWERDTSLRYSSTLRNRGKALLSIGQITLYIPRSWGLEPGRVIIALQIADEGEIHESLYNECIG
jgi:hypothetical protein